MYTHGKRRRYKTLWTKKTCELLQRAPSLDPSDSRDPECEKVARRERRRKEGPPISETAMALRKWTGLLKDFGGGPPRRTRQ
ncbi:hypothetical protein NDU88_002960 [Pleurodeles waltl]|uniref:Uncharacterized protein n=1 Tax=Pleurodeles waltl TaxID=8319 RepID=A0AAV7KX82_PLEWA|nr:hypothetical protein NDU88_002960 [Pleurodeles waltl]